MGRLLFHILNLKISELVHEFCDIKYHDVGRWISYEIIIVTVWHAIATSLLDYCSTIYLFQFFFIIQLSKVGYLGRLG